MTHTLKWHNIETGEDVTTSQVQPYGEEEPPCPICGQRTEYWEGQVDQDVMGNDIRAYHYVCYADKIGTELVYLD